MLLTAPKGLLPALHPGLFQLLLCLLGFFMLILGLLPDFVDLPAVVPWHGRSSWTSYRCLIRWHWVLRERDCQRALSYVPLISQIARPGLRSATYRLARPAHPDRSLWSSWTVDSEWRTNIDSLKRRSECIVADDGGCRLRAGTNGRSVSVRASGSHEARSGH